MLCQRGINWRLLSEVMPHAPLTWDLLFVPMLASLTRKYRQCLSDARHLTWTSELLVDDTIV